MGVRAGGILSARTRGIVLRALYRKAAPLLFCALAAWGAPAGAANIAVEAGTGVVLAEQDADRPMRPASLVKLMTAYLAFQAVADRHIKLDDEVEVSRHAARRPPVRLGLRPGQKVVFGEMIEAAVIGSKNDAAAVVAEAVADSEEAFVERMNATANRLGMMSTRFANATGLPATGQRTTARDLALLVNAMLRDYPKETAIFAKRATRVGGRHVGTTNPLFGRVKGALGLKTGFTCGAGYTIAALVERKKRKVIVVSLGHPSKSARIRDVRKLIDRAFKAPGGKHGHLVPRLISGESAEPPWIKDCGDRPAGTAVASAGSVSAPEIDKDNYTELTEAELALFQAELNIARGNLVPASLAQQIPRPKALPAAFADPPPLSGWGVFLGAHRRKAEARAAVTEIRDAADLSRRKPARFMTRSRDSRVLAVLYGLDLEAATKACHLARSLERHCVVLSPGKLRNKRARWRH